MAGLSQVEPRNEATPIGLPVGRFKEPAPLSAELWTDRRDRAARPQEVTVIIVIIVMATTATTVLTILTMIYACQLPSRDVGPYAGADETLSL